MPWGAGQVHCAERQISGDFNKQYNIIPSSGWIYFILFSAPSCCWTHNSIQNILSWHYLLSTVFKLLPLLNLASFLFRFPETFKISYLCTIYLFLSHVCLRSILLSLFQHHEFLFTGNKICKTTKFAYDNYFTINKKVVLN